MRYGSDRQQLQFIAVDAVLQQPIRSDMAFATAVIPAIQGMVAVRWRQRSPVSEDVDRTVQE